MIHDHAILIEMASSGDHAWMCVSCPCGWAEEIHRPVTLGCVQEAHDLHIERTTEIAQEHMKQTSGIGNLVLRF